MMWCGELNSGYDENKWAAESEASQTSKHNGSSRVTWLDSGKADYAGCEEEEADEQGSSDGSQFRTCIAVEHGTESTGDPEWLAPRYFQEWISLEK